MAALHFTDDALRSMLSSVERRFHVVIVGDDAAVLALMRHWATTIAEAELAQIAAGKPLPPDADTLQ